MASSRRRSSTLEDLAEDQLEAPDGNAVVTEGYLHSQEPNRGGRDVYRREECEAEMSIEELMAINGMEPFDMDNPRAFEEEEKIVVDTGDGKPVRIRTAVNTSLQAQGGMGFIPSQQ